MPITPPLPPDPSDRLTASSTSSPRSQYFPHQPSPTSPVFQPRDQQNVAQESTNRRQDHAATQSKPSTAAPVVHRLKDAVNTAFDQSPSTNQLDPEFMKRLTEQVTEQVIKNLQAANIATPSASAASSFHSQPSQPSISSVYPSSPPPQSPTQASVESLPPNAIPASPRPSRMASDRYAAPERAQERAPSDGDSLSSKQSWEGQDSSESELSTQSNNETTPRGSHAEVVQGLRRTKTAAVDGPIPLSGEAFLRRKSSGASTRPFRKDSKNSDSAYFDTPTRVRARTAPIADGIDPEGATTLEKIWQPLFDNGNPTMRLSQFLRGLAKHIIDDYEPKHSIVIPPAKVLRFLEETKVAEEHYPWATIFGGKLGYGSISTMYRKLLCQHHFIQQQYHVAPMIPALTPQGFESLMTCIIQAHPDTEFERLAKAVREMPISNADDIKERFPKELSRRLLPSLPNVQAEQRLISSLNHEPIRVRLERGTSAMPPPPPAPPASAPPQETSFKERERNPYSQTSQSSNAVDDDDLSPPAIPLERERKPYYAREGTGKRYDAEAERERDTERESAQPSREPGRSATNNKYRQEFSASNPPRTNLGVPPPQTTYIKASGTDPMNIPPANRRNRMGTGPPPLPSSGSYGKSGRRSPPPRGFARSEPMDVNSIPASQYASNLYPGQTRERFAADADEDTTRYSRRQADRYTTEDDANGRPIPRRGPSSGPPIGNNTGRNGVNAGSQDQRRQSWFPSMPPGMQAGSALGGTPGTDGYGSYAAPPQNGAVYGSSGQY